RQIDHSHVAPVDAPAEPGAERLGAGLLGGEALGIGGGALGPALGFGALDGSEAAHDEPLAMAGEGLFDAADLAQIAAEPDDHWAAPRRVLIPCRVLTPAPGCPA